MLYASTLAKLVDQDRLSDRIENMLRDKGYRPADHSSIRGLYNIRNWGVITVRLIDDVGHTSRTDSTECYQDLAYTIWDIAREASQAGFTCKLKGITTGPDIDPYAAVTLNLSER
jgi:hypothetical protein